MSSDFRLKIILEGLENGVAATCRKYNISRTLYYRWLKRYKSHGIDGLKDTIKNFIPINKTSEDIEQALLNLIKDYPHYGPRALKYLFDELGYRISESAVYNIMKRYNLTKKELRIRFANKSEHSIAVDIPTLTEIKSGECWMFWITDYGYHENIGKLYEYTFFDLRSRIACTRLYNHIDVANFEDLLAAVAIPVAKTLHLNINYLCFYSDDKILRKLGKTFKSKIAKIILNYGLDFQIYILSPQNKDLSGINILKENYTKGCLSFLLPLIDSKISFDEIKLKFQDYIRDYNLKYPSVFQGVEYSPVEYHNSLTQTKLILPLWAYMGRQY